MFDLFAYFQRRLTAAIVGAWHDALRIVGEECQAEETKLIETTATRIETRSEPSERKPRRAAVR